METFDGNVQINRYDAEGLRYEMDENGQLVQFIFNTDREVVAEKENEWTIYIRGSELLASSSDHARTYYHYASDEMSSITHIVDYKEILNEYEYDAWGNVVNQKETVKNRFKFNGQQLDPITQQYYLRARFYNPIIARFTQEDTYRGDGLNLYIYCANNPIYYVDPSGNACEALYKKYKNLRNLGFTAQEAKRYIDVRKKGLNVAEANYHIKRTLNNNTILKGERTGSALKSFDGEHGFPDIIDNYIDFAVKSKFSGGDGIERTLYQLEGGFKFNKTKVLENQKINVNGNTHRMDILDIEIISNNGIFEWIVEPNGDVSHRRFIKDGIITGYPNQRVSKGSK